MKVQGPMSNVGSQLRLPVFCKLYEKTNGRNNRIFCNFQFALFNLHWSEATYLRVSASNFWVVCVFYTKQFFSVFSVSLWQILGVWS